VIGPTGQASPLENLELFYCGLFIDERSEFLLVLSFLRPRFVRSSCAFLTPILSFRLVSSSPESPIFLIDLLMMTPLGPGRSFFSRTLFLKVVPPKHGLTTSNHLPTRLYTLPRSFPREESFPTERRQLGGPPRPLFRKLSWTCAQYLPLGGQGLRSTSRRLVFSLGP